MKKISILLLGLLGMMAVSCEDDLPVPNPQENEQGPILTTGDITGAAEGVMTAGTPITLADYVEPTGLIPVYKVSAANNLPAGATLSFPLQVSNTPDFKESVTVTTLAGESENDLNVYYADVKEWNAAQLKLFGTGSTPMKTYYRIPCYVNVDGSNFRYQSTSYYAAEGSVEVKRIVTVDVEDSYYLVGNFCDWDLSKAIKMSNSQPGITDVYANPVFTAKVDITEDQAAVGYEWMVVPASTVTANNYGNGAFGCEPDSVGAVKGKLVKVNAQETDPCVIKQSGPMLISVNMEEQTYFYAYAFSQIYAFTTPAKAWTLHTDDFMNYNGVAVLGAAAYFGQEPKLSGTILFKQNDKTEPNTATEGVVTGDLVSVGGKNIKMPLKGNNFYWCALNLASMTYQVSNIATLSVVGDGNDWDEKNAPLLTPSKDFKVWTGTGIKIGTKFKLNANHAWKIAFGSMKAGVPVAGGTQYEITVIDDKGDMDATPGTYDVEVNFGTFPYTVTLK